MSEDIGTTSEYKTRSAVDRCSKVAYLRMKVNSDQPPEPDERFGVVLERYVQEEIPKRFSTKHAYLSYINNHICPKWDEFPLTQVKPFFPGLTQNNPGQEGQTSIGQQNERSHQRAHAPDLRLCDVVGVPAPGPQSDVSGANRGQFEAKKETSSPHARGFSCSSPR